MLCVHVYSQKVMFDLLEMFTHYVFGHSISGLKVALFLVYDQSLKKRHLWLHV